MNKINPHIIAKIQAPAKINIFLKITDIIKSGSYKGYHALSSRFVRFARLYDELFIIDKLDENGLIYDNQIADNLIFKAYEKLCKAGFRQKLDEFFKSKQIYLIKNIPSGAGLGGASSDASAFLTLINKELNLNLKSDELLKISATIGADVSFFTSSLQSANVSGFGEILNAFDDEIPSLELLLSSVFCSTPKVYMAYDANNFHKDINLAKFLSTKTSMQILNNYQNYELNDLLAPALTLYPNLQISDDEFLSGSGSAKFKLKDKK